MTAISFGMFAGNRVRASLLMLAFGFTAWPMQIAPSDAVGAPNPVGFESPGRSSFNPALSSIATVLQALTSVGASPLAPIDDDEFLTLQRFYPGRGYSPLWVDSSGLRPAGTYLLARLTSIGQNSQTAVAQLINAAAARMGTDRESALGEVELLLSAGLIRSAISPHDPAALTDGLEELSKAAQALDVLTFLRQRLPVDPAFWRLRAAIHKYHKIEAGGGWPQVPAGTSLHLGDQDARIRILRERLFITGDLVDLGALPDVFDSPLDVAVRRFQARHGLVTDGIVGRNTIDTLNVPIARRLSTMNLNLRRLQLQAREWGRRYIVVNAASATYRLVDGGRHLFERAAIVGRPDWPTPPLDSVIERLEFHPYWVVPPRIARLEVLPRIRRDPSYLRRNDMRLIDGQVRQDPGPKNPLGVVKFVFPNRYYVYLHDTNRPDLFDRAERFLSHGCIRVSGAVDLAAYLLGSDPLWPRKRIEEVVRDGGNQGVRLTNPITLHIVYDTAWVDETEMVEFRPDVYGRDRDVAALVADAPTGPAGRCAG